VWGCVNGKLLTIALMRALGWRFGALLDSLALDLRALAMISSLDLSRLVWN
jgi:hypothetical protein